MKKLLLLGLSLTALSVNASMLDTLKTTPASKYELGKAQLEIMLFIMSNELKGENIIKTDFIINRFSIDEKSESIGVRISLVGKAKDILEETCTSIHEGMKNVIAKDEMIEKLWPSLSESDYLDLMNSFIITTELVSKDNSNHKVSCI